MFVKHFIDFQLKVTIGDLIVKRKMLDESLVDYIIQ